MTNVPAAALAHLRETYLRLESDIAGLTATCNACGQCCHFETADHILFCTDLEFAHLLACAQHRPLLHPQRCPYQVEEHCKARDGRPLGCRLHFCRPSPEVAALLERLSQRYHDEIAALCEQYALPRNYAPLLDRFRDSLPRP